MSEALQVGLLIASLAVVFVLVSRAMARREARWESDDWRQPDRGGVKVGNALLEIHSLLQPDRRHQLEEVRRERRHDEDSGDPPDSGTEPADS